MSRFIARFQKPFAGLNDAAALALSLRENEMATLSATRYIHVENRWRSSNVPGSPSWTMILLCQVVPVVAVRAVRVGDLINDLLMLVEQGLKPLLHLGCLHLTLLFAPERKKNHKWPRFSCRRPFSSASTGACR